LRGHSCVYNANDEQWSKYILQISTLRAIKAQTESFRMGMLERIKLKPELF